MNRNSLYITIAVLAMIGSAVIVVSKKIPKDELELLLTKGVVPASLITGRSRARVSSQLDSKTGTVELESEAPVERTDEDLNKWLKELPILDEIPWLTSEIATMYSNRTARPCQILKPDTVIDQQALPDSEVEGKLISQRVTAFLVGLAVDPRARGSLPAVSKATIENYLSGHLLAIQPEVCRNRNGNFMLTGQVNAAFFAKTMPSISGSPEPMVLDAVKSFRVLGVLPPTIQKEGDTALPRTLVMAFSYARDKVLSSNLTLNAQTEYELLFLHLLPQTEPTASPPLAVFTTTDGRTVFQELDLEGQKIRRSEAAIMANIRFENFKLMGVYPANPIVTGLRNKVRSSLPLQELQSRIAAREGGSSAALEVILDELHNVPEFTTNPAAPASFPGETERPMGTEVPARTE